MPTVPILNLLAACLLLISFAMLSRRRTQRLITLFAWQGGILFLSTCLVAHSSGLHQLYYSAALTLLLKVIALPLILRRLIYRLGAQWDSETMVNIPITMLAGLVLVIFAFGLAQPISRMAAMENGLFFAATSATYGMPMVIELGIALDVLVGVFILGLFFFQIREQFESLDLPNLETLKED